MGKTNKKKPAPDPAAQIEQKQAVPRCLHMLEMIRADPTMTTKRLAEYFGIEQRTVERNLSQIYPYHNYHYQTDPLEPRTKHIILHDNRQLERALTWNDLGLLKQLVSGQTLTPLQELDLQILLLRLENFLRKRGTSSYREQPICAPAEAREVSRLQKSLDSLTLKLLENIRDLYELSPEELSRLDSALQEGVGDHSPIRRLLLHDLPPILSCDACRTEFKDCLADQYEQEGKEPE